MTTETQHQIDLIKWFDRECLARNPERMINIIEGTGKRKVGRKVGPLFAIPNGAQTRDGARQGAILRHQGARSGVPDLMLAWPVGGLHGMFIEMKTGKGRMSPNQISWGIYLHNAAGYYSKSYWSAADASSGICDYLGWPDEASLF